MPNSLKRLVKVDLTFTLQGVDHLHKYYLRGFSQAIAASDEVEKSAQMIAGLEDVLVRSGYLTEGEIKARHLSLGITPGLIASV